MLSIPVFLASFVVWYLGLQYDISLADLEVWKFSKFGEGYLLAIPALHLDNLFLRLTTTITWEDDYRDQHDFGVLGKEEKDISLSLQVSHL